ncbi:MAG: hypothetical protein RBS57_09855 [Desulforhabdus sp.]|nr:hypothetical protein [Desulforhabdus sp.]
METSEYKKPCTLDDQLLPHGAEINQEEASLLCIDGKWVNKEDLVSVGC